MLKSTQNTYSREQFTKLREARRLIRQEFDAEFSLQSNAVMNNLYDFALRSSSDELFDLFGELHQLSSEPVENPLGKEQFIMLREARVVVQREFDEELSLRESNVMDRLYDFALRSASEELFDIFMFLASRPDAPGSPTKTYSFLGERFKRARKAVLLIKKQFGDDVPVVAEALMDTLGKFAPQSEDGELTEILELLKSLPRDAKGASDEFFAALSKEEFERLREAKRGVAEEFGDEFSLHSESTLRDLYRFALRSEGEALFDLFSDLLATQKNNKSVQRSWFTREQFMLLRKARDLVRSEFDQTLLLESETVQDDLYQFALRSETEQLFDLCAEFATLVGLSSGASGAQALPSKEVFRTLRTARSLVNEEFGEELQLQSDVVQMDVYKFAVRSEADDLFDLHLELEKLLPTASVGSAQRLTKDEFVALRVARKLVRAEFDKELPLDSSDVLDRLYDFALESEGEELFDLHAALNARAARAQQEERPVEPPKAARPAKVRTDSVAMDSEPTRIIEPPRTVEPKPDVDAEPELTEEQGPQTKIRKVLSLFGAKTSTTLPEPPRVPKAGPDDDGDPTQPGVRAKAQEETLSFGSVDTLTPPTLLDMAPDADPKPHGPAARPDKDDDAPSAESDDGGTLIDRAMRKSVEKGVEVSYKARNQDEDDSSQATVANVAFVQGTDAGKSTDKTNVPRRKNARAKVRKSNRSNDTQVAEYSARGSRVDDPAAGESDRAEGRDAERSVDAQPVANKSWYVSSLDGRLGVRLFTQLNIGMLDGELLVGAPSDGKLYAVINMVDHVPVLLAKEAGVLVNDSLVAHSCELSSGDRIRVEESILQVEYLDQDRDAGVASSRG